MKQFIIESVWPKVRVFLWGFVGMGLMAVLTFLAGNLELIQQALESLSLSPAMTVLVVGLIANLVGQATKWVNQRWNLEEKIGNAVNKLRGK